MIRALSLTVCLVAALMTSNLSAQQMEINSPAGALTSNGVDPTPGSSFAIPQDDTLDFEIRGGANTPYILIGGELSTFSLQSPFLNNQFFDLNINTAFVFGDGVNATGGVLPSSFFNTNSLGEATWSLPVTASLLGQSVAFQGLVEDFTQPSLNLNITAAAEFLFVPALTISGTGVDTFILPSGNVSFYGQNYGGISVSSQGWVRMGTDVQLNEFNNNPLRFLNGTVGVPAASAPAPIIAAAWDNFDMTNATTVVQEPTPGVIDITWSGGSVFDSIGGISTPFGTFSCTIDTTGPGTMVLLDFSAATITTSIQNVVGLIFIAGAPLVGISDGSTAGSSVYDIDLNAGPFTPMTAVNTIYQDYSGGFGTIFNLNGQILTFHDPTNTGDFRLL